MVIAVVLIVLAIAMALIGVIAVTGVAVPATSIPLTARQSVTDLNPHTHTFGPFRVAQGYKVDSILEDAVMTISDADIAAGETFAGVQDNLSIYWNGQKIVNVARNGLNVTCDTLARRARSAPFSMSVTANAVYQDTLAVNDTATYAHYEMVGPFPAGVYQIKTSMLAATDEWGGADVNTSYSYGFTMFISKATPYDRYISVNTMNHQSVSDATRTNLSGIGIFATALSSVASIEIDGKAIGSVAFETSKREWLTRAGGVWSGSLPTTMVGFFFSGGGHSVKVTNSSAQAVITCGVRYIPRKGQLNTDIAESFEIAEL